MSAFSKFYHHQFCDSVPFSMWFAIMSSIPLFSEPGPRNDRLPDENLVAQIETRLALNSHSCSLSSDPHEMSLNIDMKMIRPLNTDGSLIFDMNSWTLLQSCNVVNLGKYSTRIPPAHHQLCPKFCIVMNS